MSDNDRDLRRGTATALDDRDNATRRREDDVFEVVEEEIVVGKCPTEEGGMRATIHVTETPLRRT